MPLSKKSLRILLDKLFSLLICKNSAYKWFYHQNTSLCTLNMINQLANILHSVTHVTISIFQISEVWVVFEKRKLVVVFLWSICSLAKCNLLGFLNKLHKKMKKILTNWKSLSTPYHTQNQTFLVCKIPPWNYNEPSNNIILINHYWHYVTTKYWH